VEVTITSTTNPEIVVSFDGACSKGRGRYGVVAQGFQAYSQREAGKLDSRSGPIQGHCTNNIAEWTGMIQALELIRDKYQGRKILLIGDSQLVIRQLEGRYSVTAVHLKPFYKIAKEILESDDLWLNVVIRWVPREQNRLADREAKRGKVRLGRGRDRRR
jgi:ribonuclease HI